MRSDLLVYLRRGNPENPVELVIVVAGVQTVIPITDKQVVGLVAEGAGFLATRRGLFRDTTD